MNTLQLSDCLILITDDDVINRVVLKHMLKEVGIKLEEATDGEECLTAIKNSTAKRIIVLLDLNMPVMDGYEVIKQIKSQSSEFEHIRILVVSASLYSHFTKSGLSDHIHGYIEKPVDREHLLTKVIECSI